MSPTMSPWKRVAIILFAMATSCFSAYRLGQSSVEHKVLETEIKWSTTFHDFAKKMYEAYEKRDKEEIEKAVKEKEAEKQELINRQKH